MKKLLMILLALAFVGCAQVDADTYKKLDSQYGRTDGWYIKSDGEVHLIVDGSESGAYFDTSGNFTTGNTVTYTNHAASGTLDVAGISTFAAAAIAESTSTVVSTVTGINFADMKVFDGRSVPLTVAPGADDDLTYYEGTFGTNAAWLQSYDCGGVGHAGAGATQKAIFTVVVPQTLPAGATVSLVANAGMQTTVADQAATLDFSCYVADYTNEDGTMSGDLITTAAQSVNSTTVADKTFALDDDATGYVLTPGAVLECLVTTFCDDDGNAAGGINVIVNRLDLVTST